ncbi:hypothetical protein MASR1M31_04870 [Porphyromonadaceae bacterium]
MPMQIKLNNKTVEVHPEETLIEVARREGYDIPSLCYAKGYKHKSSCMVCVVKNSVTGQVLPSCTTVPVEGMEIDTESDEVRQLRRQALELLMSDHVAKCVPPCNPKHCALMTLAASYKAKFNTYPRYSGLTQGEPVRINDHIVYDKMKCIRCGLCVYNTTDAFTFKGRGFSMEVVIPAESMGNVPDYVVSLCPTGAIYEDILK